MALADSKGTWWISSGKGPLRYRNLTGQPDHLKELRVTRLSEDSDGDIWMAVSYDEANTRRGLVRWIRATSQLEHHIEDLPPAARAAGVASLAQGPDGQLWFGLENPGGLLRRRRGQFQMVPVGRTGHVNQLLFDRTGKLWFATTEAGLGHIGNPGAESVEIRHFSRAEGLSSHEVWSIAEDLKGRIYAGTARGVDRLDPATNVVTSFSTADGLAEGDIRSALRDRSGNLWFSSSHGVSLYSPEEDQVAQLPPARITGLRVAGVPRALSELGETDLGPWKLAARENSFQIDFAAANFRPRAAFSYEFKLDGSGEEWQRAGTSSLQFANLPPGDYAFRVRTAVPGVAPGPPASFSFVIIAPVWQRWWFRFAALGLVIGLAYLFHVYRVRQHVALERVRTQIATDLHDEIGAGLSRISVLGDAMRLRAGALPDGNESALGEIVTSARGLVASMDDIVWSLNPQRDHVEDLVTRLRAFGSDLLETRGISWTVEATFDALARIIPLGTRRQIYLLFQEGIHNICKHSAAHRAELRFWIEGSSIIGELADDGVGISDPRPGGMGLTSMRARAARIGGGMTLDSAKNTGTRLRVHIPL